MTSLEYSGEEYSEQLSTNSEKIRKIFVKFWTIAKCQFTLSWALTCYTSIRYLNPIINSIMCGHLSTVEMDGVGLGNSFINIFGLMFDLGFSCGIDTLMSQAYGAKKYKLLGVILQRAFVVMTLIYLILASIHLNIEPIFLFFGQKPENARIAAVYMTYNLPGLYCDFIYLAITRYLQNQNLVRAMLLTSLGACAFNILSQYIVLFQLGYRYEASAVCYTMSNMFGLAMMLVYLKMRRIERVTWPGWQIKNLKIFRDWSAIFKLGIPGIFFITIEAYNYEIGMLLAGLFNNDEQTAQLVVYSIGVYFYLIQFGLAIAVQIRVGQMLGRNSAKAAKLEYIVGLMMNGALSAVLFLIQVLFNKDEAMIFNSDKNVLKIAAPILFILAILPPLQSFYTTGAAAMNGCGRQLQLSIIVFVSNILVGLPLGCILAFPANMKMFGYWIGLLTGNGLIAIGATLAILLANWQKFAEIALKRSEMLARSVCDQERENKSETVPLLFEKERNFDEDLQKIEKSSQRSCKNQDREEHLMKNKMEILRTKIISVIFVLLIFFCAIGNRIWYELKIVANRKFSNYTLF